MLCTLKQKRDEMAHSCILNNICCDDLKNYSSLLRIPCLRYKPFEEPISPDDDWAYLLMRSYSKYKYSTLSHVPMGMEASGKDPRFALGLLGIKRLAPVDFCFI